MKISTEITQDKELIVKLEIPENTELVRSPWLNAYVEHIDIYNTKSYIDGIPVFSKDFGIRTTNDTAQAVYYGYNDTFTNFFLELSEHDINIFEHTYQDGNCRPTNVLNDIIIVVVSMGYFHQYEAEQTCCGNSGALTSVLYDPCVVYNRAISAMGGCDCKDMCEDNLPYGFMYALLKKKAVDACIRAGHLDMACRYYLKFFKDIGCDCQQMNCGCNNNGNNTHSSVGSSNKTKNCGCHG